jgi:uncharacterized protein (TIGR02118 family)
VKKIVTLVRGGHGMDRDELRARCLEALAKLPFPRASASFVDVPPQEVGLDPATPAAPYDAVLETWHPLLVGPRGLEPLLTSLAPLLAHAYLVREIVQQERARSWPLGQRSPGVKGIYPVTRRAGLTAAGFERHWRDVHGPLALRHHAGMCAYVQNVVVRPLTPGTPPCDGISALCFPSARDMRERFIDSARGARRIADDVSRFVGSSLRLDASEYVVRD